MDNDESNALGEVMYHDAEADDGNDDSEEEGQEDGDEAAGPDRGHESAILRAFLRGTQSYSHRHNFDDSDNSSSVLSSASTPAATMDAATMPSLRYSPNAQSEVAREPESRPVPETKTRVPPSAGPAVGSRLMTRGGS